MVIYIAGGWRKCFFKKKIIIIGFKMKKTQTPLQTPLFIYFSILNIKNI